MRLTRTSEKYGLPGVRLGCWSGGGGGGAFVLLPSGALTTRVGAGASSVCVLVASSGEALLDWASLVDVSCVDVADTIVEARASSKAA